MLVSTVKEEREYFKVVQKEKKEETKTRGIGKLSFDVGWSIALPLIGAVFIGQFLDKKFGTEPKITLIGIGIGILVGLINLIIISKKALEEN